MKRLLVIGASVLQVPAILRAKAMGFMVATADFNPLAPGAALADRYYNVSTIDEEGVYRAARDFRADGVMTLATDMPMRALAYACGKLGLPGLCYDSAVKATDKAEMIRAFAQNGVARPWYQVVQASEMPAPGYAFPMIVKPTDSSGSRGVTLVASEADLPDALQYAAAHSRSGAVILEEYLQGPEVSVEIMVASGVPHVLAVTDKVTAGAPHFVEMGHAQPSRLPQAQQEAIRDLACQAALAVGIEDGPAHAEIILTNKGPKMVEIGARMGGDCIASHLVPLSTGVDMVGETIRMALGEAPDLTQTLHKAAAIRYFDLPCGVLRAIEGVDAARHLPGVREITFVKQPGDEITAIGSSNDRAGFVIAQADTADEAIRTCERAMAAINIIVE